MTSGLASVIQAEFGISARASARFASIAGERLVELEAAQEDADEDLILRLRQPRVFGEVVVGIIDAGSLDPVDELTLAERCFDLLPLPLSEADVVLVEARAPPRLLAIAAFLIQSRSFTVLHLMHLVYAVFLDHGLPRNVDRATRSQVLRAVLLHPETSPGLRGLYAALHLASIEEREAAAEFRWVLRSAEVPAATKRWLVSAAADPEGSARQVAMRAREEGLLPPEASFDDPGVLATIPHLPARLGPIAARWRSSRSTDPPHEETSP